jgi:phage terminase small subunit
MKLEAVNQRVELFIAEYVANGGNGTAAAIKAGVPETTAPAWASKTTRNNKVMLAVEKSLRAQIKRIDARGDKVITELFRILSVNIKDAVTPDGALKPINEMDDDLTRAISGIEIEEIYASKTDGGAQIGVLKKVKFWSKTESANLLGKHLKLWAEAAGVELFVNGDVEMTLNIKT